MPNRPGKLIQLELKTTTVAGPGRHEVRIDLGQLWDYHARPLGQQPFYVFPRPHWRGDLVTAATADGLPASDLGFKRSAAWWFANWMVVLTTSQVARILHSKLAAHGSSKRGEKAWLVRFDLGHGKTSPAETWAGHQHPRVIAWREFWPILESCGRAGWPQLVRLPAHFEAKSRRGVPHAHLLGHLHQAAYLESPGELVTFEPGADGTYQVADLRPIDDRLVGGAKVAGAGAGADADEAEDEAEDRRMAVFLEARAFAHQQ